MELQIKRLDNEVKLPVYKTLGSAGMDICANEDAIIPPGKIKIIKTGLAVAIPMGYEIQIRSRSGLSSKYGIFCINGVGTIDSDYRGEVGVPLANFSDVDFKINKGDRIAQMVCNKIEQAQVTVVEALDETVRGVGGFGSTGIE